VHINDIYTKYSGKLKRYIDSYISSKAMSDDMVQDIFYKFIVANREDPIESVSSWLYRVARNQIIDYSRKHKEESMPYLGDNQDDDGASMALSDVLIDDKQNPETEYIRSVIWEELEKALQTLPKEQQDVFELHELQGISFKEISEATNTPINTLISRKRYAVMELRKRLNTLYE